MTPGEKIYAYLKRNRAASPISSEALRLRFGLATVEVLYKTVRAYNALAKREDRPLIKSKPSYGFWVEG